MVIDGVYAVAYCGSIGLGVAMLKVENGQVIGHDYVGSVIAGIATELPSSSYCEHFRSRPALCARHQTPIPPGVWRWRAADRAAVARNDDSDGETRSRQLGSRSHEGLLDSVENLNG